MTARRDDLITAFQSARMQGQESAETIDILHQLEEIDEPEVTRFLANVALDGREYDLARIEALKALETRRFATQQEREHVAGVLRRVLSEDEDDEVRRFAARTLSNVIDVPGVLATAGVLVADEDEDVDVRHNAFFSIERSQPTEQAVDLVTTLLSNDEFKSGAARVLARWHGLGR